MKNDRFVMQTTTKNRKRNDRFLKRSLFQKVRFKRMVVFIKIIVSLTIDNDDPSLMIVNEEKKPTSKGICNSHWVIFKKTSRSSPTTFKLHVRRHLIKLHFFQERSFLQKDRFYKVSLTIINIISKKISKTIVIRFLKVKNEWVVFKTICFPQKRNNHFWKRLKNETKNYRLKIVFKTQDMEFIFPLILSHKNPEI